MKKAICLITIRPNKIWLNFLNNFENYDIYVVVDDLITDYDDCNDYKNIYPNIQFIKVSDDECRHRGYIHSSYMPTSSLVFNEIIAWDRALCYFTNMNKNYEHVWFFEDDVFFYSEETLLQIELKHRDADLLCKEKNQEPKAGEWDWFWPVIQINFPGPYFHSPICAIRLSKTYLEKLDEYIIMNKKLAFIEALLPSIAYYNNLKVELVDEFNQIHWRRDWQLSDLNKNDIFHPMKNMEQQREMRELIHFTF
jgi:hypothetical protein